MNEGENGRIKEPSAIGLYTTLRRKTIVNIHYPKYNSPPLQLQEDAFEFGKNIAYAHQLREDLQNLQEVKPPLHLLSISVIVSAAQPEVRELIQSLLHDENTEEKKQKLHEELLSCAVSGETFSQIHGLCELYSSRALDSMGNLPNSEAKQALENIIYSVAQ